jgi:membrane protein implicated in regulation of membrane protease activity
MKLYAPMPPFDEADQVSFRSQASAKLLNRSIWLLVVVVALAPVGMWLLSGKPLLNSLALLAVLSVIAVLLGRNIQRFWRVSRGGAQA